MAFSMQRQRGYTESNKALRKKSLAATDYGSRLDCSAG